MTVHRDAANKLATWLEQHQTLLRGLGSLRRLGPIGDAALARAMSLPEIRTIVPSWELWSLMAAADGIDPDLLLADVVSEELLDLARFALWGTDATPGSGPQCEKKL